MSSKLTEEWQPAPKAKREMLKICRNVVLTKDMAGRHADQHVMPR